MNRILMNIKYKLSYQSAWAAWYLIIYAITMFLIMYSLIKTSLISSSEGSLVYRLWGLAVFQFAISIRFREDFDFFLTLSNTRKDIFQSLVGVALGFSVIFSGLIVLEHLIINYLNNVLGYHKIVDPFHFFSPYAADNNFLLFVFFFILCLCCSMFGLMMGSLFYRFGRRFVLAFWLMFSSVFVVFLPLFIWYRHQDSYLSKFITAIWEFLKSFDVLACSGYLFILTIFFGIAAYLNIRRLPQK